jgi:SAM-dependent methyltransferase
VTDTATGLAEWFESRRQEVAGTALAPDTTELRQGGWRGAPEHYRAARELILDGIPASGDLIDIGCANGLLLASLIEWGAERGIDINPHGIDIVPELVELAQQRFPEKADQFAVANGWDWSPGRQYRWVHTDIDHVPAAHQAAYLQRLLDEIVEPGGRLIVSSYGDQETGKRPLDIELHLQMLRFRTAGCSNGLQSDRWVASRTAWIDKNS